MPIREDSDQMFVSISTFAKRCDVSIETVRRWVKDNTIPSVKIGGRRLIDVQKLQKDIDKTH